MRKLKTILMSAALGVGLAAGAAQAQERVFFGIATGGTGGTYYPLGGMLAQVIPITQIWKARSCRRRLKPVTRR